MTKQEILNKVMEEEERVDQKGIKRCIRRMLKAMDEIHDYVPELTVYGDDTQDDILIGLQVMLNMAATYYGLH